MASLVLSGDTSGSITVSAPAVSGSNTQTLAAVTGTLAPIVSGTAITLTNQTAPDFTGIPSWVKRITVMLSGLSTNGTGIPLIQLGDAGGYETTGYTGVTGITDASPTYGATALSSGVLLSNGNAATYTFQGSVTFTNISGNIWVFSGTIGMTGLSRAAYTGGSKTLSATLTSVRLYIDGTQQFDAGTINILYE